MFINKLHISKTVKAITTSIILDLIRINIDGIDVRIYFCIIVLKK